MPLVDDQRRCAGAHLLDLLVQCGELIANRELRVGRMQSVAEPRLGPGRPARFAALVVDEPVGQCVRIPGCGHRRVPVERRQRRQRAVQAVVHAPRHTRSAVVDQVAVAIAARVGPYFVPLPAGDCQRVLDRRLMSGVLYRSESPRPVDPLIGMVGEAGGVHRSRSGRWRVVATVRLVDVGTSRRWFRQGIGVSAGASWPTAVGGVGRCRPGRGVRAVGQHRGTDGGRHRSLVGDPGRIASMLRISLSDRVSGVVIGGFGAPGRIGMRAPGESIPRRPVGALLVAARL